MQIWLINLKKLVKSVYLGVQILSVRQLSNNWIFGSSGRSTCNQEGVGAHPASVAYDTLNSAVAKNADVVII